MGEVENSPESRYPLAVSSSREPGSRLWGCRELPEPGQPSVGPMDLAQPWARDKTALSPGPPIWLPPRCHRNNWPSVIPCWGWTVNPWPPPGRSHNTNLPSLCWACSPGCLSPRFGKRERGLLLTPRLLAFPNCSSLESQGGSAACVFTPSFRAKGTEISPALRLVHIQVLDPRK